jgi:alpha-galactosidase
MSAQLAFPVGPTASELWQAQRWTAASLLGGAEPRLPVPSITVVRNNDTVQQNERLCAPMRFGNQAFNTGLFCHANSRLEVRLASPAERFEALVGVDSNAQTQGGRGSVVFSVLAGDTELYKSEVMREGDKPAKVSVPLGGATEFALEINDGGDGISCDQADWASAKVTLQDGKVLWLGELPMEEAQAPAFPGGLPFSFTYDGKPSAEVLPTWERRDTVTKLDRARAQYTYTFTEPETRLEFECVAVQYSDYPAVEWTCYFKNLGTADTPIIEDIQALDTRLMRYNWPGDDSTEFRLHYFTGSPCRADDYEPHLKKLRAGEQFTLAPERGRPTSEWMCYFNLQWPSEGVMIGLGWPGQWEATFERDSGTGIRLLAGQQLTHLKLRPGEAIRAPLVAMVFYKGDWIRGQNLWRRWMVAHNIPRPYGQPPKSQFVACSSHQYGEMVNANSDTQKLFIQRYLDEGIKLDYWWMDAGWYEQAWGWPNTGTWEVDQKRFPGGLRPITDYGHERGVDTIVWFEPERVTSGTWLWENHPEWLLGEAPDQRLLNLGNPEAVKWLTDHTDGLLKSEGIDLYREDYNIDPLTYWRAADAEDRQGMCENLYVQGHLAYWDELLRRHPDMLIDSCASGGRRNDLETLRRAVPLLRSDYILEPIGNQGHTYGISFWIPYYGSGGNSTDPYLFRSVMCPSFNSCFDMRREEADYETYRKLYNQWREVAPDFLGDYYPLTNYSLATDAWIGWQFDAPEKGQGFVQVFKRPDSIYEAARLRLRGLEADAKYTVTNMDTGNSKTFSGKELLDEGYRVTFEETPDSLLLRYKRWEK